MSRRAYEIEISRDEMIAWVQDRCCPEEVFSEQNLAYWAKENGWVKEVTDGK